MKTAIAADAIVEIDGKIVIVERKYEPDGLCLPGGHVDTGETAEQAVVRELKEETGLDAVSIEQFRAYSGPERDPRYDLSISVVFACRADGSLKAGDDAKRVFLMAWDEIDARKDEFAFDHYRILHDYKSSGKRSS